MKTPGVLGGGAVVGLLLVGSESMAAQANDHRIAELAAELRQGDPWPSIRADRIREALPKAMDAAEVDAWVLFCRENHNDPLARHVGGENAGGLTAFLFLRQPSSSGIEMVVLVPESEVVTLRERLPFARSVGVSRGGDIFALLAEEIGRSSPKKIAVNQSELAAADGLTATHREKLIAALGPETAARLTSSEELVVRWLGAKLPAEIEIMRKAAILTDRIEREAFDDVAPGKTTNADLHHAIRRRIESLGLGHSWPDNPGITTGLDRGRGSDLKRVIKPGDLINIDAGIKVYDLWCTDIQRFAYVLRPGETAPPAPIQHAWESAKHASRKMLAAMRPGVAGWEVDKVQIEVQDERGSLRHWAGTGHPVGYWAHDVGPSISGYSNDRPPSGRSTRKLDVGMVFGYDGNFVWPAVDEGVEGTKSITIEEMGLVTEQGGEYLCPPQEDLVLIPAERR